MPCLRLLPLRRSPAELLAVMGSLQEVLTILTQQRQLLAERPPGQVERGGCHGGGLGGGRLHWLLLAAAGYGQSLLSKADVAALIISRKILLTPGDGGAEAADDAVRLHGCRVACLQWRAASGALCVRASGTALQCMGSTPTKKTCPV